MKIRILENVKTDLTEEEILSILPEEVDPIGISEIKVKNCLVKYFLHKDEIVITEVKPLPKEVETNSNRQNVFLAFLQEQAPLLPDKDLYLLYKTYKDKSFKSIMKGDLKKYGEFREFSKSLRSEIRNRIDSEC